MRKHTQIKLKSKFSERPSVYEWWKVWIWSGVWVILHEGIFRATGLATPLREELREPLQAKLHAQRLQICHWNHREKYCRTGFYFRQQRLQFVSTILTIARDIAGFQWHVQFFSQLWSCVQENLHEKLFHVKFITLQPVSSLTCPWVELVIIWLLGFSASYISKCF